MGMESFGSSAPLNKQDRSEPFGKKYLEKISFPELSQPIKDLHEEIDAVDGGLSLDEADSFNAELDEIKAAFTRIGNMVNVSHTEQGNVPYEIETLIDQAHSKIREKLKH